MRRHSAHLRASLHFKTGCFEATEGSADEAGAADVEETQRRYKRRTDWSSLPQGGGISAQAERPDVVERPSKLLSNSDRRATPSAADASGCMTKAEALREPDNAGGTSPAKGVAGEGTIVQAPNGTRLLVPSGCMPPGSSPPTIALHYDPSLTFAPLEGFACVSPVAEIRFSGLLTGLAPDGQPVLTIPVGCSSERLMGVKDALVALQRDGLEAEWRPLEGPLVVTPDAWGRGVWCSLRLGAGGFVCIAVHEPTVEALARSHDRGSQQPSQGSRKPRAGATAGGGGAHGTVGKSQKEGSRIGGGAGKKGTPSIKVVGRQPVPPDADKDREVWLMAYGPLW
jgi:hypothetical protein